jgi:hypothetical protein
MRREWRSWPPTAVAAGLEERKRGEEAKSDKSSSKGMGEDRRRKGSSAGIWSGEAAEWSGEGDEEGFWIAGAAAVASDNDLFCALLPAYSTSSRVDRGRWSGGSPVTKGQKPSSPLGFCSVAHHPRQPALLLPSVPSHSSQPHSQLTWGHEAAFLAHCSTSSSAITDIPIHRYTAQMSSTRCNRIEYRWISLILYLCSYFYLDSDWIVSNMSDWIQIDIDIINIRFEYPDTNTISNVEYPDSNTNRSEPF